MPLIANLTALLAAVGPVLAATPYSDGQSIETVSAQELGSTTVDGAVVHSMNFCSIVHSTQCYTVLSTGSGRAPELSTSTSSATAPGNYPPAVPTYGQPDGKSSGASVPAPTPSSVVSGNSIEMPPATTVLSTASVLTTDYTSTSETGAESGTSVSSATATAPTGAAPMGASVMANAFVAALAVLII